MILVRNISRDRASFARTWGHALAITSMGFSSASRWLPCSTRISRCAPSFVLWFPGSPCRRFARQAHSDFRPRVSGRRPSRMDRPPHRPHLVGRTITAALLCAWARAHSIHPTALVWAQSLLVLHLGVAASSLVLVTVQLGSSRASSASVAPTSAKASAFRLSSSSISVYNDIDKTFLVTLGQTWAAGIYSAAYRVVDAASAPIFAVYAAAAPRFFREGAMASSARAPSPAPLSGALCPTPSAPQRFLFLGAPVLPLLFGPSFRGSVAALRWLCVLPILRSLHYAWGSTITASASQWNRTATQFGAAAFNLLPQFSSDSTLVVARSRRRQSAHRWRTRPRQPCSSLGASCAAKISASGKRWLPSAEF